MVMLLVLICKEVCLSQWVVGNNYVGGWTESIIGNGNDLLVGTVRFGLVSDSKGIYRSTDNGITWSQTSFNIYGVRCFVSDSSVIYAGSNNGLYVSTNGGISWSNPAPAMHFDTFCLCKKGGTIYLGDGTAQNVVKTTNRGVSWTQVLTGNTPFSMTVVGENIFVGTINGTFLSTNNGSNWNITSLTEETRTLSSRDNAVFAGTLYSLYKSTNLGVNWLEILNRRVNNIAIGDSVIIVGGNGISISGDNGNSWNYKNEGFNGSPFIRSLLIWNNYVYAGIDSNVWRRPLNEIIGIEQINTKIPEFSNLKQNFPNPFNPNTSIEFSIPKETYISIKIYNSIGQLYRTEVNQELSAGTYKINVEMSDFPSGIFFYQLITNDFKETKKMVMIK